MTTLTNNLNEKLFTELTPEESAVIGGGVLVKTGTVNFDNFITTGPFKNNRGTKIQVNTNTRSGGASNPSNNSWTLFLQQFTGGRYKTVDFKNLPFNGSRKSLFTGLVTGGTYRLKFEDIIPKNDGKRVIGSYAVYD
jgi:hypothetical protein